MLHARIIFLVKLKEISGKKYNEQSVTQSFTLTLDKLEHLLILLVCLTLFDQIDLVLQDYDVVQLHDLDRSQMFLGLWLWTRLVAG